MAVFNKHMTDECMQDIDFILIRGSIAVSVLLDSAQSFFFFNIRASITAVVYAYRQEVVL